MRYIAFIFLFTFAIAQNNGIRSLNGSLNNSQRLTIDTSSSATFKWTISNGVHTVYIPYRIASMTSGGGSVGNADSLGSQPASYYAVKADSIIVSAGYGMSVSRSLHTTTVSADTTILPTKSNTNIWSGTNYFTARDYHTSIAIDTMVDKSNNGGVRISDTLNVFNGYIYNEGRLVYRKIFAGVPSSSSTYGSSIAVGDSVLSVNTAPENTATGIGSLLSNTTGGRNSSYGYGALQSNTTGRYLSAFGFGVMAEFNTDSANSAFGYKSGVGFARGSYNTLLGFHSVQYGDSGKSNVVVGADAGQSMYNSDSNVAVGRQSLFRTRAMRGVTALGFGAGYVNTTTNDSNGTYNTWLGMFASPSPSVTGLSKSVGIGYNSKVGESNTIAMGGTGSDTVRVTIGGTTVPYQSAIANGSAYQPYLRVEGGTYTNGTIGGLNLNISGASSFGSTLNVAGAIGANSSNGITTTQSSFPLLNATATTINFGGATTLLNIGADSVRVLVNGSILLQNRISAMPSFDNPAIYGSDASGVVAPFNANGNLVIQPRTSAARDIYFMSNSGTTAILRDGTGGLTLGTVAGTGSLPLYSGAITSSGLSTFDSLRIKGARYDAIDTTSVPITLNNQNTILCNNTANITITLPALALAYNSATKTGKVYHIKKINSSGASVTIDGNGTETIDGNATITFNTQWTSYEIQAHSTGWYIK